jgi:hypothetical protein
LTVVIKVIKHQRYTWIEIDGLIELCLGFRHGANLILDARDSDAAIGIVESGKQLDLRKCEKVKADIHNNEYPPYRS